MSLSAFCYRFYQQERGTTGSSVGMTGKAVKKSLDVSADCVVVVGILKFVHRVWRTEQIDTSTPSASGWFWQATPEHHKMYSAVPPPRNQRKPILDYYIRTILCSSTAYPCATLRVISTSHYQWNRTPRENPFPSFPHLREPRTPREPGRGSPPKTCISSSPYGYALTSHCSLP